MGTAEGLFPAALDHLVYVTRDMERTIQDLNEKLGVAAAAGGRHPIWGTRNALLSLGPKMYLEIMGPDTPGQDRLGQDRPFGIDRLVRPRLAAWVAKTADVGAAIEFARRLGVDLGSPLAGSRAKPDGSALFWEMSDLMKDREGGILPFFINWGDSAHPADDAPQGCLLRALRGEHPEPERVGPLLKALGLDLKIDYGPKVRLVARIETKNGFIDLQ